MASIPSPTPPEIGPDGLIHASPVIAYTERIIQEEQLQLRKYIEENYSKIRDVERDLANLSLEMKLTAGPKKAALEYLRKKIEMSTERIQVAKTKEEQARKVWEEAAQVVKDEEAVKEKLCEDLNNLVKLESTDSQMARLEELKRRLEALNPSRVSTSVVPVTSPAASSDDPTTEPGVSVASKRGNGGNAPVVNGHTQPASVETEGRGKKKNHFQGRGKGRGIGAAPKSRAAGWTGAGFDVDARS